jgi:hypothetical protein
VIPGGSPHPTSHSGHDESGGDSYLLSAGADGIPAPSGMFSITPNTGALLITTFVGMERSISSKISIDSRPICGHYHCLISAQRVLHHAVYLAVTAFVLPPSAFQSHPVENSLHATQVPQMLVFSGRSRACAILPAQAHPCVCLQQHSLRRCDSCSIRFE